jgi:aminoglycoside phosphotransferase family enzyme
MKALIREARIFYYRAAMNQIRPCHPDAHYVYRRYQELINER